MQTCIKELNISFRIALRQFYVNLQCRQICVFLNCRLALRSVSLKHVLHCSCTVREKKNFVAPTTKHNGAQKRQKVKKQATISEVYVWRSCSCWTLENALRIVVELRIVVSCLAELRILVELYVLYFRCFEKCTLVDFYFFLMSRKITTDFPIIRSMFRRL